MKKEQLNELERIRRAHGGILRKGDVIREAESEDNPLHPCFDWDDTSAARRFRMDQAGDLIQLAVTILPQSPGRESRCFVSLLVDRNMKGGGYRSIVDVLSDKKMREAYLSEALMELKRFEIRYHDLKELAEVFRAAKNVRRKRRR